MASFPLSFLAGNSKTFRAEVYWVKVKELFHPLLAHYRLIRAGSGVGRPLVRGQIVRADLALFEGPGINFWFWN